MPCLLQHLVSGQANFASPEGAPPKLKAGAEDGAAALPPVEPPEAAPNTGTGAEACGAPAPDPNENPAPEAAGCSTLGGPACAALLAPPKVKPPADCLGSSFLIGDPNRTGLLAGATAVAPALEAAAVSAAGAATPEVGAGAGAPKLKTDALAAAPPAVAAVVVPEAGSGPPKLKAGVLAGAMPVREVVVPGEGPKRPGDGWEGGALPAAAEGTAPGADGPWVAAVVAGGDSSGAPGAGAEPAAGGSCSRPEGCEVDGPPCIERSSDR